MSKLLKLNQEFLIVVDKANTPALYSISDTAKGFCNFLSSENSLKILKNKIIHNGCTFDFHIKPGIVKNKSQRFFYLIFRSPLQDLNKFKGMLSDVKKVISQESVIIETLRDDISLHYSQKGYSLIYSIENSMRKFITYFMITNVGKEWVNDSPENIKDALRKSKRKQYMDVLHQLDFIHLGDFLFKKYQSSDADKSFERMSKYKRPEDFTLSDIDSVIPRSNWDKYFKSIVKQPDDYLKTRWSKLYEFRNIIAHSSSVSEFDLSEIETYAGEIQKVLDDAFKSIDAVELEDNDRKTISERIARNIDRRMELFFEELDSLEVEIRSLDKEKSNLPLIELVFKLKKDGVIDANTANKIEELLNAKSNIVFEGDSSSSEIKFLNEETAVIRNQLRSTWIKDVYKALTSIGGEGTLEEIYRAVEEISNRDFPESWETIVRKAIYTHSSDTDIYNGTKDLFKKSGRGKWMIRNLSTSKNSFSSGGEVEDVQN